MLALPFQRKVDHHDAVLLHDSDQKNNADDRDHTQILMEEHERQQRSHAGGRQCGKNGDGMNEALVKHTQNNVDRDERCDDKEPFVGERVPESRGSALELGLNAGWHLEIPLDSLDSGYRIAKRGVGRQVERYRYRGKLTLAIDRKRRPGPLQRGEGAEWHGIRGIGTVG